MLYRGQNLQAHNSSKGIVAPKGSLSAVAPEHDGSWVLDGKFTYGVSENNAARAHHIDTGKWNGCFISTTRDYEIAHRFATKGNTCEGVIYHIDETLFEKYGIAVKTFTDPLYPEECEVSIRMENCAPLPSEVIVRIEEVFPG